jgi:hypothetical protein
MSSTRRFLLEWIYAGLLIFVIGGYIGYLLLHDHLRIEAQEKARLASQVEMVADNLARQLKAANLSLENVLKEIPDWRRQKDGNQFASRYLSALTDAMPGVLTMLIVDAGGTIIAADKAELVGRNLVKRDFFMTVKRYPNPKTLYVSVPFLTSRGNFTMNFVRLIPGPAGQFDGMVVAALDPNEFKALLSAAIYEPDMSAFLVHGDGMLFLSVPDQKKLVGMEQGKPDSFFTQQLKSGQTLNVFQGNSYALGEDSMVAMVTVQPEILAMDKPLVVAVGRNLGAIYKYWREELISMAALFWIVALMTITGLYFYQKKRKS